MTETMLRITAPHFTAGVVLRASHLVGELVVRAAPILRYMHGWPRRRVLEFAARKKWRVD